MNGPVVRAPASSANLGAGFDVFAMALDLFADVGSGQSPDGAQQLDAHHPARVAFERLGGTGPLWMRSNIPMGRGLGFSGAARVAAAALAVVASGREIDDGRDEILAVTTELEGHGDNVAASSAGGVVAFVDGRIVPFRVGPVLAGAVFVAWVPDVRTSTDASRRALSDTITRRDAVFNIGRATQFALAFAHDDPELLRGATADRLHQAERIPLVPGAAAALDDGVAAGAWCAWLSGSGPTVGLLCDPTTVDAVASSLPTSGHTKRLAIDALGARLEPVAPSATAPREATSR